MTQRRFCFAALCLPLLFACGQAGNVTQAIDADEANAQAARHDGEVRGERLEALAEELNMRAAREGGTRGRALRAEAQRDSNAAAAVYEAGQEKARAIETNIGAELNGMGKR